MHAPIITSPTLTIRSFASIPHTPLQWLWHHRIPRGKITLLAGDPGSGKTALSLDLAARLSRALPMPPLPPLETRNPTLETSPAATLLLSPDDNAADTLRPRLDALHADLSLIHTLPDFPSLLPPKPHPDNDPDLPTPLQQLDAACSAIPHLALLIIDPITHYLGLTDRTLPQPQAQGSNPCGSPRSLLHALATLAQKHNIALLLTSRLIKKIPDPSLSLTTLHRTLGSLAFATSARSILLLLPHPPLPSPQSPPSTTARSNMPPSTPTPLDPPPPPKMNNEQSSMNNNPPPTHLLLSIKSNLTQPPPPLAFTLTDTLHWHPEPLTHLPPRPLKPIADESFLAQAVAFLHSLLANGPIKATRAEAACKANTISHATLRRARTHLQIACRWSPEWSAWFWSLADDHRPIPRLADEMKNQMSISESFVASLHNSMEEKEL